MHTVRSFKIQWIPVDTSIASDILWYQLIPAVNLNSVLLGYKHTAVPLQARSGPEGSRKLRFPDFVTTTQDGGKVVSLTHRPPLLPGNAPGTHFC